MDRIGGERPPTAVATFPDLVLAAQWGALRAWVDAVPPTVRARPSILPGWSIDELLSHLATSVGTLALLRPVTAAATDDQQERPLPVLDHLTGYRQRSASIRERSTRAAAVRSDRGAELDEAWARAGRALVELGPRDIDRADPEVAAAALVPDGMDDVRLVLLAAGRDLDHAGLGDDLRAVLPLF